MRCVDAMAGVGGAFLVFFFSDCFNVIGKGMLVICKDRRKYEMVIKETWKGK